MVSQLFQKSSSGSQSGVVESFSRVTSQLLVAESGCQRLPQLLKKDEDLKESHHREEEPHQHSIAAKLELKIGRYDLLKNLDPLVG